MKKLTWLLLLLPVVLILAPQGHAQVCGLDLVCSNAGMTFVASSEDCEQQNSSTAQINFIYPAGGSQTWNMWTKSTLIGAQTSTYAATQTVPMIVNSTIPPANGQCIETNPGVWHVCPGLWQEQTILVTEASDHYNYYEFYLRGYSAVLSGSGCAQSSSYFGQVYHTASVTCCDGSGGCCADNTLCDKGTYQCDRTTCVCVNKGTPIVVDTDGKGFHLTSAKEGVMFDLAGDGRPQQFGWTAPGSTNAWLLLDRGLGTVVTGKQLFGNYTPQPPCSEPNNDCKNGYRALRVYDQPDHGGNGDGIIDYRDAVFCGIDGQKSNTEGGCLRLWIDANHDGIAQPEELHALPELGVYSIGLNYDQKLVDTFTDQFGNYFRYRGDLNPNPRDGHSKDGRFTYDVILVTEQTPAAKCRPKQKQPDFTEGLSW